MADDNLMATVRVVNLGDEQLLELIRGVPVMLHNEIDGREVIIVCHGMDKGEVEEAISSAFGEGNIVVMGRKLDG